MLWRYHGRLICCEKDEYRCWERDGVANVAPGLREMHPSVGTAHVQCSIDSDP
jgi:hypothetical protein